MRAMPRYAIPGTRSERRGRAGLQREEPHAGVRWRSADRCLYCYGPLTNGRAVCSDECDDGLWAICPTTDGELFEPA
jgi:hypothetical protein